LNKASATRIGRGLEQRIPAGGTMKNQNVWCAGALALLVGTILGAHSAHADSMRCGNQLVSDGDSLLAVESRCGPPAMRQHRTEVRSRRQPGGASCPAGSHNCGQVIEHEEIAIDEWTYDFGPQQFMQLLHFEQGRLVSVVTLGRGSAKPRR
jgi:hypothetical protein